MKARVISAPPWGRAPAWGPDFSARTRIERKRTGWVSVVEWKVRLSDGEDENVDRETTFTEIIVGSFLFFPSFCVGDMARGKGINIADAARVAVATEIEKGRENVLLLLQHHRPTSIGGS